MSKGGNMCAEAARADREQQRDTSSLKRMGATKVVVIKNSQFIPRVPPIRHAVVRRHPGKRTM